MASGNFSSTSYNGLSLYIEWSSTANVNANTSNVTARVYVKSYSLRATALSDSYVIINGNKKNWTHTFNISSTSTLQTTQVTEYTVTVPHNADGTKSITIKANMEFNGTYGGTYVSDITASKTVTLDAIPRASSFSVASSINTGSSLPITIVPSSSLFKHKVAFEIDGETKNTSDFIAAGTTSYSYTIPHSWLPSSTSKTVKVYLYTYTGNGDYLAYTSKNITVNVPSSIKPTVSSLTSTVIDGLNGKYVQGKSKVTLTATASAGSGSSLSSYIFKGANISGSSSSYTGTSNTQTSSVIQTSGTVQYEVAAKDTRGRISDYQTVSINVHAYAVPQITSISAQRCLQDGTINNDGTYAKVTVKTSYSSVNGANTRTVKLYNSEDNFVAATTVLNTTDTETTYVGAYGGTFDTSTSYVIKAVIQDAYNTHNLSTDLKVSERTINIAKNGNGVAIGGMSTVDVSSTSGLFEVNWNTNINANETINGNLTVNGSTTLDNLTVNGPLTASNSYRINYQTIPSGADLDDAIYRVPGFYRSTSSTNSITNKPSEMNNGAFELVVTGIAESSYCTQTLKDISSNTFYVRTQTSWSGGSNFPTWTAWNRILTSDIPSNKYYPNYGINMNNSDIIGANSIYFGDRCDSADEGINFLRCDGGYDVLYAADGGIFLRKNQSSTPVRALTDDLMAIRRGTCTLNVSSATTVNFSSALPGVPTVMLTPLTTNSSVIAAKVRSVTASGFTAIIGGSGISDTQFAYLAIWTLQS